jgi:hypothetical protein
MGSEIFLGQPLYCPLITHRVASHHTVYRKMYTVYSSLYNATTEMLGFAAYKLDLTILDIHTKCNLNG